MQSKIIAIVVWVCVAVAAHTPVVFAAAGAPLQPVSESRPLLHTFTKITVYAEPRQSHAAIDAAYREMDRVNRLLNNYDPGSEISRLNAQAGGAPVVVSPDTCRALTAARTFGRLSGGAFDCTIGPLLALWGFMREKPGIDGADPTPEQIAAARQLVDYRLLQVRCANDNASTARLERAGMRVDVGAFSKGYVADRAMQVLEQQGIPAALVAAGGTIVCRGMKPGNTPWQIGIRHPRRDDDFLTVVSLKDCAVSTSGDYERYYRRNGTRRTHIIDPRSGRPVERMQAVTVIAPDGMVSDALSTALFVLGPQEGLRLIEGMADVEALMVDAAGEIVMSTGWPQRVVVY